MAEGLLPIEAVRALLCLSSGQFMHKPGNVHVNNRICSSVILI